MKKKLVNHGLTSQFMILSLSLHSKDFCYLDEHAPILLCVLILKAQNPLDWGRFDPSYWYRM